MCFPHDTKKLAPYGDLKSAFTLIELLLVISIIVVLMALLVPAFMSGGNAQSVTSAAYLVQQTLDESRAYAVANNTYVWVGFYEQSESQSSNTVPATPGTGRVVLSTVASKDGTMIYSPPNSLPITSTSMSASLTQINKLVKIDNIHLQTFTSGSGTGSTFPTRPAISGTAAQIGAVVSTGTGTSQAPFLYPLTSTAATAQYTFYTAIQFSPRGEARMNEASHPLQPVMEVGLQQTHGNTVDVNNQNVVAVQISGIAGNIKIYRQ